MVHTIVFECYHFVEGPDGPDGERVPSRRQDLAFMKQGDCVVVRFTAPIFAEIYVSVTPDKFLEELRKAFT